VLLLNVGEAAEFIGTIFEDDGTGTMEIPDPVEGDNHLKHHWTMPGGVSKVMGVLTWENAAFDMEAALGIGICPHRTPDPDSVVRFTSESGSPLVFELPCDGCDFSADQWFVHVGALNEADLAGQSCNYAVKVYLTH
jgi:hypothetical protein